MEKIEKGMMMMDLPESCISHILSFTTPRDVCRLSAVNQTFNLASKSDSVWKKMLPIMYPHLLARIDSPLEFSSKKELYFTLCHPNWIDGRSKKFWIEQATGKLCFMLSARNLDITWGDDDRYWNWISQDDSSFKERAELVEVCWLEVREQYYSVLLPFRETFSVLFKLKLHESPHGIFIPHVDPTYARNLEPVKCLVTPYGHDHIYARYLSDMNKAGIFIPHADPTYAWNLLPVECLVTPYGHDHIYPRFLSDMNKPVGTEGYQMQVDSILEGNVISELMNLLQVDVV